MKIIVQINKDQIKQEIKFRFCDFLVTTVFIFMLVKLDANIKTNREKDSEKPIFKAALTSYMCINLNTTLTYCLINF